MMMLIIMIMIVIIIIIIVVIIVITRRWKEKWNGMGGREAGTEAAGQLAVADRIKAGPAAIEGEREEGGRSLLYREREISP